MFTSFAAIELHINIATSELFSVGGFGVTNAMLTGTLSLLVMLAVFGYVVMKLKKGQYNRFVGTIQWAFEGMLGQIYNVIPNQEVARKIAPFALTIFFYVLVSYWMSILPGLESIFIDGKPLLRSIAADLNFTFALALLSLIATQYYAIRQLGGVGNLKRYFRNPVKDPIGAFEGVLELIGEVSRYSALSLRLFGNCFAGEVLLLIMSVLTGYAAALTLPAFMAFELFIGFIQAYVFFMLTIIFTALAIEGHGDAHNSDHQTADTARQLALDAK